MRILIVNAVFYEEISAALLAGATTVLNEAKVAHETIEVPGALEIPAAIAFAHASQKYAAFVALGCVIRGETSHYDIVCNESAGGLNALAVEYQLAIGNGILTVENEAQAWERADPEGANKGGMAARTALWMLDLKKKLESV